VQVDAATPGSRKDPISVEDGSNLQGPGVPTRKAESPQQMVQHQDRRNNSPAKPCEGILLPMPPGISPFGAYPFMLHDKFQLPWNLQICDNRLTLYSHKCQGDSTANSCRECEKLLTNGVVEGIMDRIRGGVHENSPLAYQPIAGLIDIICRKNEQLQVLRSTKLAISRLLAGHAQTLDDYKKFVMALGEGKTQRVDALIRAGLRRGAGVCGLLQLLDRANQGLYSPKGFTEEEMLHSILFQRLGGSRVASLAHRTLGLPGLSTVRQNSLVTPLIASAGTPTMAQIQKNIKLAFENADVEGSYGYVLMIDEIAIEQRFRWDPTTNNILGVCREHSTHLNLNFCSINDVKILFREILENKCHYGKEVIFILYLTDI